MSSWRVAWLNTGTTLPLPNMQLKQVTGNDYINYTKLNMKQWMKYM
jgi:hypothetical protein